MFAVASALSLFVFYDVMVQSSEIMSLTTVLHIRLCGSEWQMSYTYGLQCACTPPCRCVYSRHCAFLFVLFAVHGGTASRSCLFLCVSVLQLFALQSQLNAEKYALEFNHNLLKFPSLLWVRSLSALSDGTGLFLLG